MYFVGIDISKYKHDCFIATEVGEVIKEPFSFSNTNEGFLQLLTILKSLDSSKEKNKDRIWSNRSLSHEPDAISRKK